MTANINYIFVLVTLSGGSALPVSHDVCDEVFRSLQFERTNGNQTPSPIDVNFCMGMIQHHSSIPCAFDGTTCNRDCGVIGFEMDQAGCQISCNCKLSGLFEEDIKYEADDVPVIEMNYLGIPNDVQKAASVGLMRWNQNLVQGRVKVPYVINDEMTVKAKTAIRMAIAAFSEKTCVDFVERGEERDYIHFVSRGGCWSYVGRRGGSQEISIGNGCEWKGVVQHELMHALGFWHEQSRPDRDEHVIIQLENVMAGKENNFNVRNSVMSFGSPYDPSSLMHYGGYAFSKNLRPTILHRSTNEPIQSQRNGFTEHDLTQINAMYECPVSVINSTSPTSTPTWSEWGLWGKCSVSCGEGTNTRTRSCIFNGVQMKDGCIGTSTETKSCKMKMCLTTSTVSGSWGSWQSWGTCSKSCGNGLRWRKQKCVGGYQRNKGCDGLIWQSSTCNTHHCISVSQLSIFGEERWVFSDHVCRYGKIYAGDFNGDGRGDLLCYYSDDWTVVYLATSSGRFSSPDWQKSVKTCKNFNAPGKLMVGDLNGDGRDDILCQDPSNGTIRVSFAKVDGFETEVSWEKNFNDFCNDQQNDLMLIDVNGDDLDDLVCKTRYGELAVLYNNYQ